MKKYLYVIVVFHAVTAQNALSLPPIESTAEHLTEGDEGSKNRDRKE